MRKPRELLTGAEYHVTVRGLGSQVLKGVTSVPKLLGIGNCKNNLSQNVFKKFETDYLHIYGEYWKPESDKAFLPVMPSLLVYPYLFLTF